MRTFENIRILVSYNAAGVNDVGNLSITQGNF